MKESVSDIRVRVIKQQAERLRILSGQVEILKEELAMRVRKEGLMMVYLYPMKPI